MKEYYSFKIPEPCNEDWNQMTPSAKGRFCSSCEKTVIDFTKMSSFEISNYLKENMHNGVCGRIYKSQLDRVVVQIPAKMLLEPRLAHRFFALALLIVMGTTLFSCVNDSGNKQKIDAVEVIELEDADSLMLGVVPPPKAIIDSTEVECGQNLQPDSSDEVIPITGGFDAAPPPAIETETTGDITIEGAFSIDHHVFDESPYTIAQPPEFPNTPSGMNNAERRKYFSDLIQQHIKTHFNEKVLDTTILGRHRILTQFKIDVTGKVTDVKVKSKYEVLEKEARRVLKLLPLFKPSKNNKGENVAVTYALPIILENKVSDLDHVIKSFPKVIKDIPFLIVDKTPRFVDSPKDISEIEN
ncbi:TonB-like protein [Nonlabens dokdonensis]|uniref:TonB C-terminal domain-containing protein n=2 Tax=Nonlabens dokdonensis TaxID=328515 RepID=L7WAL8_NONDD|nr:energy transducer TonB [Nonlabens dokdonensis]AGC76901.1 uncharacterized protein DDD_1774 [Nonlabens dokdonensis DSW-6]PZX36809.1 TonB-like protein [Nonlabens dokdonensis]